MGTLGQSYQRQAVWDRNPNVLNPGASAEQQAAAPHALTGRTSYTTPTNFRTLVSNMYVGVWRVTAAGAALRSDSRFAYTASGGATEVLVNSRILSNGVGDKDSQSWHGELVMLAGDQLTGQSQDTSTTGTCDHMEAFQGVEFSQ